jgi:CubicO group peptidase (beta-lactamase class C family)
VFSVEGLRGAAIVTRAGSIRLEVASGLADAGAGVECTPQTRFQISSVSKQFVAVAVLLLAESGQLGLTEPVARWLPGCPPQWRRVTLHHLLTHTAGVRHWGDAPVANPSQPMDPAERVALIQQAPLLADPGTRWQYSSPGYVLAGHIVAQASGRPYPDFLTGQVLAPLRLTATSAGGAPADVAAARGYHDGEPAPCWPLGVMPGTGDICSTVSDLARFTVAVHSGSLITPRSVHAMMTPHAPLPEGHGTPDGWMTCHSYGYAQLIDHIAGHPACLHLGDTPGYQSLAARPGGMRGDPQQRRDGRHRGPAPAVDACRPGVSPCGRIGAWILIWWASGRS